MSENLIVKEAPWVCFTNQFGVKLLTKKCVTLLQISEEGLTSELLVKCPPKGHQNTLMIVPLIYQVVSSFLFCFLI